MDLQYWIWIAVGISFTLYIAIAIITRASSTGEFYIAGKGVPPIANGMATAADWMSAASFISMAGLIAFLGKDGSVYLMGWTGGYVLLALLLAPYLRKFGQYTVPDFIGTRYYSKAARLVAVICLIFVPSIFIEQDPQMPSLHERLKVKLESISCLILIKASSTIGPHLSKSIV